MSLLWLIFRTVDAFDCRVLETESDYECVHKQLLPLHYIEILSFVLVFVICNLANATGIGGGGLLVPLLVLLMQFPAHEAIPLSKSIILGGAIVSVLMSLRKQPIIIDFHIVALLQPMILLGTAFGVVLNQVFPDYLILLLLTATLGYVIYKNITKGLKLYQQESQKLREEKRLSNQDFSHKATENHLNDLDVNESIRVINVEDKRVNLMCWVLIGMNYIAVLMFALMKGGSGMGSIVGIEKCSAGFWVLAAVYMVFCVIGTYVAYEVVKKYVKCSGKSAICYSLVSFFGGIGSGMLGLGGGVIISPLMLDLGITPEVTAASSSLIVLFTSSSTSLQFFLGDALDIQYATVMFLISMLSSATGITIIAKLIKKYKRPSIIVFILAIITIFSAILLPIFSLYSMSSNDSFTHPC